MAAKDGCFMSVAEARQKCHEKHSCFQPIEFTEHICLPPCYIGRLKEGINNELSANVMKFCDKLEGVIVAYDKIELIHGHGSLVDESPLLHFDVKVNYIVFQPQIDSKLVGEVNKFGYDHIGCLVHGCFNASIAKPRLQNGYDINSLAVGSKFTFRVVGLESLNGVLLISGVLDDKSLRSKTKCTSAENINVLSDQADHSLEESTSNIETHSSKKRKHKNNDMTSELEIKKDINSNQSNTLKLVRKKTKKKKKICTM